MLFSCVTVKGTRVATTNITSTPEGAEIFVIHEDNLQDAIYAKNPKSRNKEGKVMSFVGVTPMQISVPKGEYTKVVARKQGYKETIFTVKAKKEASYFNGKNKDCLADKYYIYATPFMVWDEFVMKYVYEGIKKEYCSEVRHSYHINLIAEETTTSSFQY